MKRATLLLGLVFCLTGLYANNVQISAVNLVEKDTVNKVITIAFDITWENSWRTSSAPYNHDAAWIFMKFKNAAGEWHHATLSTDSLDYSPAAGLPSLRLATARASFYIAPRTEAAPLSATAIGLNGITPVTDSEIPIRSKLSCLPLRWFTSLPVLFMLAQVPVATAM